MRLMKIFIYQKEIQKGNWNITMSFLKASTSFTRFTIVDNVPNETYENLLDKLKQFAVIDIDEVAEERSYGWTNFDDMLDTAWERSIPQKGAYITFSLRLDTRRIPPAVQKKYVSIALRQEEERVQEQGKKFVSRDRKKEIIEQVKLRLRARFLPVPAEFLVVWAMDKKMIYLGSTQRKVIEMFTDLFGRSFELGLEQILPYSLAHRLLGDGCEEKLNNLQATTFS